VTVRRFVSWPDRRLRTSAAPVPEVTGQVLAIWNDMVDTIEAMPGVGLAAPQIGVMLRVAVVDASDERGRAVRLATPGSSLPPGTFAHMTRRARTCPASGRVLHGLRA
jgi:peptide deformylase